MKRVILALAMLTWGGSAIAANVSTQDERSAILKSAVTTFAKEGFCECALAAVAEGAGVTPAALHRHFGSMNELAQAALAQVEGEMVKALMPAYQQKGTYRERYLAFFTGVAHYLIEHPEVRRYLHGFYGSTMGDQKVQKDSSNPELLRSDPFYNIITEGMESGALGDHMSLEETCDVILGSIMTLTQHASATFDAPRVRRWVEATWSAVEKR